MHSWADRPSQASGADCGTFATLAGCTVYAIYASVYALVLAGSGEKFWRMPLDPDLKKLNESHVADLKNHGGGWVRGT